MHVHIHFLFDGILNDVFLDGFLDLFLQIRLDVFQQVIQDIEHGLTPIAILIGTPADQAVVPAGEVITSSTQQPITDPLKISPAIHPPLSLFEPIFNDGTDLPGPKKTINPANAWANFVFNAVERYRPGGTLAEAGLTVKVGSVV